MIFFASIEDVTEICRIETENMPHPYSENTVRELFDNERVKILKAVKNNKIVGYVSAEKIFEEASVNNIAVDKQFRNQGIGNELITELKNLLKAEGVEKIFLEVASRNMPAIKLYEKNGFNKISTRKGYYGDDDAIIMQFNAN